LDMLKKCLFAELRIYSKGIPWSIFKFKLCVWISRMMHHLIIIILNFFWRYTFNNRCLNYWFICNCFIWINSSSGCFPLKNSWCNIIELLGTCWSSNKNKIINISFWYSWIFENLWNWIHSWSKFSNWTLER
jgi:hypothetical protein